MAHRAANVAALLVVVALGMARTVDAQVPPQPPATCVPFDPYPEGANSMQKWCNKALLQPESVYDALWRNAPPADAARGFSEKGCTLGCLVGSSATNILVTPVAGAWTGKCFFFDATTGLPSRITNLLSVGARLRNWQKQGLPASQVAPATMYVANSVVDGKPVWKVDYSQTVPAFRLVFNQIFDELREVRPGYVVGKAFAQVNGIGGVAFSGLHLAFLQTCGTPAGTYPETPAARVFT